MLLDNFEFFLNYLFHQSNFNLVKNLLKKKSFFLQLIELFHIPFELNKIFVLFVRVYNEATLRILTNQMIQ